MAAFVKGDVVVVRFPFSDLTSTKRRPALVVAELTKNDLILCLITSQTTNDNYTTLMKIKSNRVFTANEKIIVYKAGTLTLEKTNEVVAKLIAIL